MNDIESEIAWAAGLFEGEGFVWEMTTPALRFTYLGFGIEMTDEEIITRFYVFLARHIDIGRNKVTTRWRGNMNHSRQYAVRLTGARAEQAYALLRPYLGTRRRQKADAIIANRRAQLEAATTTRTCKGCGTQFIATPIRQKKVWCSSDCYHRIMATTPRGRELANARNRRYKQRQRDAR